MDTKRLRELSEAAIKTHPICLNDPDYGEGGDPTAGVRVVIQAHRLTQAAAEAIFSA